MTVEIYRQGAADTDVETADIFKQGYRRSLAVRLADRAAYAVVKISYAVNDRLNVYAIYVGRNVYASVRFFERGDVIVIYASAVRRQFYKYGIRKAVRAQGVARHISGIRADKVVENDEFFIGVCGICGNVVILYGKSLSRIIATAECKQHSGTLNVYAYLIAFKHKRSRSLVTSSHIDKLSLRRAFCRTRVMVGYIYRRFCHGNVRFAVFYADEIGAIFTLYIDIDRAFAGDISRAVCYLYKIERAGGVICAFTVRIVYYDVRSRNIQGSRAALIDEILGRFVTVSVLIRNFASGKRDVAARRISDRRSSVRPGGNDVEFAAGHSHAAASFYGKYIRRAACHVDNRSFNGKVAFYGDRRSGRIDLERAGAYAVGHGNVRSACHGQRAVDCQYIAVEVDLNVPCYRQRFVVIKRRVDDYRRNVAVCESRVELVGIGYVRLGRVDDCPVDGDIVCASVRPLGVVFVCKGDRNGMLALCCSDAACDGVIALCHVSHKGLIFSGVIDLFVFGDRRSRYLFLCYAPIESKIVRRCAFVVPTRILIVFKRYGCLIIAGIRRGIAAYRIIFLAAVVLCK